MDTSVAAHPKMVSMKAPAPPANLRDPSLYFNRELSWLEFNRRVLDEAWDHRHPLLERVKFLAIFSSNLDEFFMIRVSGLKDQIAAGVTTAPSDGMTPAEQLAAIRERTLPMLLEQRRCFYDEVLPELVAAGIHILHYAQLRPDEQDKLRIYFQEQVLPVLTPLAFDPGRPFPHISNLSLNLAVWVRDTERCAPLCACQGANFAAAAARGRGWAPLRLAGGDHRRQPQRAVPRP